MNIVTHGSISLSTGNTTLLVNLEGSARQIFPLPTDRDFLVIEIAPDLIAKGVRREGLSSISIPSHTAVVLSQRPIFKRLEIIPLSKDDAQSFFWALFSDPDVTSAVKQLGSTAKDRSQGFIDDVHAVWNALPEGGPATQLLKHLEDAQWAQALLEILDAIETIHPEKWAAISSLLTPSGLDWIVRKIK